MNKGWTEVRVTPAPYLHAFRKTTERGLHVLVAVRESRGTFAAYSILDHGTPRKTISRELEDIDLSKVMEQLPRLCDRYDNFRGEVSTRGPARYVFVDKSGKMQGPVTRNALFELIDQRALEWDSQVFLYNTPGASW